MCINESRIRTDSAGLAVDCHGGPTVTILPKRAYSGEIGYIDAESMQAILS